MVIPERTKHRYEPYPEYKNSGVEWLGMIPAHWEVKRLRYVAEIVTGNTPPKSDPENYDELEGLPWIKPDDLGTFLPVSESQEYLSAKGATFARVVPKEAVLTCCIGSIGSIGIAGCKLATNQQINSAIFNGRMVHQKYGFYMAYASLPEYRKLANLNVVAIINSQSQKMITMPLPPLPEQQAIAEFLNRETARIDELIAEKQKLIALLQEQRTALITHTVTKGLNPDVSVKDSGVEWLEDIPEHWEVKKIKWDTPVFRGASPRPIDDPAYFDDEGEYAWVRIADVTESGMHLEKTTQRLSELGASLSVKMEPGKLFLSIAGSVGKPCITKIKCCIHDGFVYFPRLTCDTKFLYYIFASGEPYKGLGKLGTQLNLNTDTVASIYMGFPPNEEQQAIADHLDRETTRIDNLVSKINQAIGKLQEYRSALITAAVTGKIDVRQYVT